MKHFSHPHELHLIEVPTQNTQSNCSACEVYLFGQCYACKRCNFFLHKSCSDLPQSTHHKSHPRHALTLTLFSPPQHAAAQCDTCGDACDGLAYSCRLCNFHLHSRCARLHDAEARDDRELYFLNFLKRILAEQKKLVALLQPMMAGRGAGRGAAEDLAERRRRMYNQQIQRMAGGQNQLSIVGTTSYEFARNNNNYIG
ncbi:PREDICTED: uncharacterized protein LOC109186409 [Ipomoea nil]|uniref:uncharacterized protein LOC109186409 n=1 Tax=Ipomoea nil TaxID=35883 RepID=UPI000901A7D9|nr:PREDICTED: uncharacterized protein LOC109186409 [Ipomoea nil]